jgi:23S rRNA (cytosine1962-C5)-methyltransferase
MARTPPDQRKAAIARLFPLLWKDESYFALAKPPRLDLERPSAKRGPSFVQAVAVLLGVAKEGENLIPLVLPERLESGVAVFARGEEARARFADAAEAHRLRFAHVVIARGKPPRARIAVKPGAIRAAAAPGRVPKHLPPPARLEVLASHRDLHVVRCMSPSARMEDLRRALKVGGLTIVGDLRPSPYAPPREVTPGRRPLVHFERVQFRHPRTGEEVSITAPAPREFHGYLSLPQLLDEHLHAALAARLALLLDEDTNAFRLFTGRPEGIGGLAAEKLGDVLVLETQEGKFQGREPQLRQVANWYERVLGAKTVIARTAPRQRSSGAATDPDDKIQILKGEDVEETIIEENGLRFLVRPARGLHVGLYLDQRDNRRRIRQLAAGKDVLNLFANTCGFSVAAAAGGAASTTSVDLSLANLEWGKRNFELNGLDLTAHRFIRSDAFEFFARARRQERSYDVIIADPPSFARLKKPKRNFEIRKHLVDLLAEALELLRPGGIVLVSTNSRLLSQRWLLEQLEAAAGDRPFRVKAKPALPVDFAADPPFQKSVMVEFS